MRKLNHAAIGFWLLCVICVAAPILPLLACACESGAATVDDCCTEGAAPGDCECCRPPGSADVLEILAAPCGMAVLIPTMQAPLSLPLEDGADSLPRLALVDGEVPSDSGAIRSPDPEPRGHPPSPPIYILHHALLC